MAFDVNEFRSLLDDIELYLGWLKGNELVWEWVQEYEANNPDVAYEFGNGVVVTFRSPAPEYRLEFNQVVENAHDEELFAQMEQSWANGKPWAAGTADYLFSLCANLTEFDEDSLHQSIVGFGKTSAQLEGTLEADWTDLKLDSWVGEASDAFDDTITEFNETVRGQYLIYWRHSETLFAAAAAIAVQIQSGLIPFATDVRDGLREQLNAWSQSLNPSDAVQMNGKVVSALKIGRKVVGMVPGVGGLVGKAENVATISADLVALFSETPEPLPADFTVKTSDEIYTNVTNTLADDYARGLIDALDILRSEKSTEVVDAQQGIKKWLTRRYPNASDNKWDHEQQA